MMIDLAIFHPISVHFPVVFFTASLVLDILRAITGKQYFFQVSHWTIVTGTAFLIPTVITGFGAAETMNANDFYLQLHRELALYAFGFSILHCSVRVYSLTRFLKNLKRIIDDKWFLILSTTNMILITITGDLGGYLTHGETPFFQEEKLDIEKVEKDPYHIRQATEQELEAYLEEKITLKQVIPIFEHYECASCHRSYFPTPTSIDFTFSSEGEKPWLSRDGSGNLQNWKESIFYKEVILKNTMPLDENNKSLGMRKKDRLILLQWLQNGAPLEEAKEEETEEDNDDWL